MPSSGKEKWADLFAVWNRKLHFYSGLFLLLFLWLFSFTGLLLNHSEWRFAEFWPNRVQSNFERQIAAPAPGSDLAQAGEVMRQLGLHGEIEWTKARSDGGRLDFRVSRPGNIFEVKADLAQGRAAVQRIELNAWGVMRILHTFTGVRATDEVNERDWVMTKVWALCMDGVAAGLIFMVLSSLYLWWGQRGKRWLGMVAFGLGLASCGYFVMGLQWFW